jgi:hypothetical protein
MKINLQQINLEELEEKEDSFRNRDTKIERKKKDHKITKNLMKK